MKKKIIITAILGIAGIAGYLLLKTPNESGSLCLNGNVDIRSVSTSFRVPGRLQELAVDEGDSVQTGSILGHLDDELYQIALKQADANVAGARVRIRQAEKQAEALKSVFAMKQNGYRREEIDNARAQLAAQQTVLVNAEKEYNRFRKLVETNAVSRQQADAAERNYLSQQETVKAAQAQLTLMEKGFRAEEIAQAQAQYEAALVSIEEAAATLKTAEAEYDEAKLNLKDTQLIAPADGIIMTRIVEPGTQLSAGSPILTLSLRHPVWVRAYIDEPLLDRIRIGQKVRLETDGGIQYTGKIGFISPQAEFTPKTVETEDIRTTLVYRLRIVVDEPCDSLNQGAPVRIFID